MEINKGNWEKFHKELAEYRGFSEKEWQFLNPKLKTLIGLREHIDGTGSELFKCIIEVLTNHEKRLKVIESRREKQLTNLNNEVKDLKSRVKTLEQNNSYYPTKEEIENIKVGGTD